MSLIVECSRAGACIGAAKIDDQCDSGSLRWIGRHMENSLIKENDIACVDIAEDVLSWQVDTLGVNLIAGFVRSRDDDELALVRFDTSQTVENSDHRADEPVIHDMPSWMGRNATVPLLHLCSQDR